jgi:hypothetical protein
VAVQDLVQVHKDKVAQVAYWVTQVALAAGLATVVGPEVAVAVVVPL